MGNETDTLENLTDQEATDCAMYIYLQLIPQMIHKEKVIAVKPDEVLEHVANQEIPVM